MNSIVAVFRLSYISLFLFFFSNLLNEIQDVSAFLECVKRAELALESVLETQRRTNSDAAVDRDTQHKHKG